MQSINCFVRIRGVCGTVLLVSFKSFFIFLVQKEIQERQNFLDKMEELGQGEKYKAIIATEISQVRISLCKTTNFSEVLSLAI